MVTLRRAKVLNLLFNNLILVQTNYALRANMEEINLKQFIIFFVVQNKKNKVFLICLLRLKIGSWSIVSVFNFTSKVKGSTAI